MKNLASDFARSPLPPFPLVKLDEIFTNASPPFVSYNLWMSIYDYGMM